MKLGKDSNRLLVYFFYDKDGVVDEYIPYMLSDIKKNVSDIIVVVNGILTEAGLQTFKCFTDNIIIRDNKGFDVWAYKTAMESLGWKKLENYDEIILMNFTMMGPVYPFKEMFDSMSSKNIDFWGITEFYKTKDDPFGVMEYGYIPDHIQSHFIAIRKSLVSQEIFHKYWDEMPMITGYLDSIAKHETKFTKYFEEAGYKWDVYADAEEYRTITHQPIIAMAKKMVAEKRCPIFKRRSFMQDYNTVLNETCGQEAKELFEYLDKHTDYNTDMILDNLLRVENQAILKKNLQWNYILSDSYTYNKDAGKGSKIALVMHIHFIDLIQECAEYAASMPANADIYVTTNSEEKKQVVLDEFSKLECGKLDVRVVPNRGRDVGPFLVEFRECIDDYDIVCHVHDKKAGQVEPGTIGTSFAYKCFENVLKSKELVSNIINTLEMNPRAGLLSPPPPNHGEYYFTLGLEWGANYDNTVELAKSLGMNVNIKADFEPIAPLGSFFWAKAKALKPLFEKEWKYDDFPEEPVADDGTILHAIERIYPFSAQSAGYYPGWVMSDNGGAIEITNLNHMLKELNKIIFFRGQDAGSYVQVLNRLGKAYDLANEMKGKVQAKLYYAKDKGFSEDMAINKYPEKANGKLLYKYDINDKVSVIRFDPNEHGRIVLKNFSIKVYYASGLIKEYTLKHAKINGIIRKNEAIFMEDDPQLVFKLSGDDIVQKIVCEMLDNSEVQDSQYKKTLFKK